MKIMYLVEKPKLFKQELDFRGFDSEWGRNKSQEVQNSMR